MANQNPLDFKQLEHLKWQRTQHRMKQRIIVFIINYVEMALAILQLKSTFLPIFLDPLQKMLTIFSSYKTCCPLNRK